MLGLGEDKTKQDAIKQLVFSLFLVACVLLIVRFIVVTPQPSSSTVAPPKPAEAHFISVAAADVRIPILLRGVLHARQQLQLNAAISGQVSYVAENFKAGGTFAKGDLLYRLENARLPLELAKAKAQYAKAKLDEQELQARLKAKHASDKRAQFSELAKGQPQLAVAHANKQVALAAMEYAQAQLQHREFYAPFSGRIEQQSLQLFQQVSIGSPIAQVYATRFYQVRLALTEQQFKLLQPVRQRAARQTADVYTTKRQRTPWQAVITQLEGHVSRNRLHHLWVEIDSLSQHNVGAAPVLPGSSVMVELHSEIFNDVIALSAPLLRANQQVWVLSEQNRLVLQTVELLARTEDTVYIQHGLAAGDRVITNQLPYVAEGMLLTPVAIDTDNMLGLPP